MGDEMIANHKVKNNKTKRVIVHVSALDRKHWHRFAADRRYSSMADMVRVAVQRFIDQEQVK